MIIYFDKPEQKLNNAYRVNFKTLLLDCERLKRPVVFCIHDTKQLDRFRQIEINKRQLKLYGFTISGDLIYYKINDFEFRNFGLDDINYIEVENVPNLDFFKEAI